MVSKTAKIIAFFLLLGLITPSGVLAQESPYLITVFNNVSDIPDEPNPDIEFNGITIMFVHRYVFMPENRTRPLDFKNDFRVEDVRKNQKSFKDAVKDGKIDVGAYKDYFLDENITFKEYPDEIDKDIFFDPSLKRYPFMRVDLKPVEVEDWTVNNITLTGKIRVHATIFKNGFCVISLVFPIVTEKLKHEYNLEGDFLVADKPLKPDDVISITRPGRKRTVSLKEGDITIDNMIERRIQHLEYAFFKDKQKRIPSSMAYSIYLWDINKPLGKPTELVKENPWEIFRIISRYQEESRISKSIIFSGISEVFTPSNRLLQIFGRVGYFEYDNDCNIEEIEEYGYDPKGIRLAEVVFLQEYMLEHAYTDFLTVKLEELREIEERDYPKKVKEIVRFRREIIIALDEFYLIDDSLRGYIYRDFVRYGKQKRNLYLLHENLRVQIEELSKISVDMNNVVMQENNEDMQVKMKHLTWLGLFLAISIPILTLYGEEIKTKIRRLRERKAKK